MWLTLHTTHPTIIVGTEFHVFVIPMEKIGFNLNEGFNAVVTETIWLFDHFTMRFLPKL